MFNWRDGVIAVLVVLAIGVATSASAQSYPGIGRAATAQELAAWDIDVRPDFKGLPKGKGTVAQGQDLWEAKCASCHGVFGESNEVFAPLVGGTSKQDIANGRVARLSDRGFPQRTTLMKVTSVSTLWDYIHRAMPWTQPKSLAPNEVYALTAYLLNLGGVLPDDFELSDANIAAVQARLPNRDGATTDHGLWPGRAIGNGGRPDVKSAACMSRCGDAAKVVSALPEHARNSHGNLAEQNRLVGAQRGAATATAIAVAAAPAQATHAGQALAQKQGCLACHGMDSKVVGPGLREVATRHAARKDLETYLAAKIKDGGQGVWGAIPMPPQALSDGDARLIAQWLALGVAH